MHVHNNQDLEILLRMGDEAEVKPKVQKTKSYSNNWDQDELQKVLKWQCCGHRPALYQ